MNFLNVLLDYVEYLLFSRSLNANGPAIKGGCVTWRSHPATGPGTLAEKLSRWQDRYGVLFAVMVQFLLRAGAVAVQVR
jgi:hypothetical protein